MPTFGRDLIRQAEEWERLHTIHFFVPLRRIPSATHQMKKIAVVHGKPHTYEPPAVRETRALFMAHFAKYRPEKPLEGSLCLVTKWIYPPTKLHPEFTWKSTKPDTDNLVKMLKDVLTTLGFWKDDAQVASETIQKFYQEKSGIYVLIKPLNDAEPMW